MIMIMKLKELYLTALLLCSCFAATAKNIATKGYLFGFASSFNDSIVYFTNIQEVDSVWINTKTKFLYSRENYSYQLRDHLRDNGMDAPTCVTVFSTNRKDIEKKYINLKRRYTSNKRQSYIVKYLTDENFQFRAIPFENDESQDVTTPVKKARKGQKNKRK